MGMMVVFVPMPVVVIAATGCLCRAVGVAAAAMRMVVMMMIVVLVLMPAAAVIMIMMMVVAMAMIVTMIVIMAVVMAFAAGHCGIHGHQIKQADHGQADAGHQDHRPEDAIPWQIQVYSARVVEIQEHSAPDEKQGDTDEVGK